MVLSPSGTEGEGEMSLPAEYLAPVNIPEYVVHDIAEWVKSKPNKSEWKIEKNHSSFV